MCCFFFSSRRRHTRWTGDWSSDVCSSDLAERLITLARRGDLHARRIVERRLKDKAVTTKLFAEIGKRFAGRPGGYTRILKLGHRVGDGADVARIELLSE